jgi:Tfp pilus assembly pilus retraction ATPase PilT
LHALPQVLRHGDSLLHRQSVALGLHGLQLPGHQTQTQHIEHHQRSHGFKHRKTIATTHRLCHEHVADLTSLSLPAIFMHTLTAKGDFGVCGITCKRKPPATGSPWVLMGKKSLAGKSTTLSSPFMTW